MHPPLFQPHPLCEGEVQALVKCHTDHNVAKFWGACNDAKHALDMCVRVSAGARRGRGRARARACGRARSHCALPRPPSPAQEEKVLRRKLNKRLVQPSPLLGEGAAVAPAAAPAAAAKA